MDYSLNINPFGSPKSFKKIINKSYKNLSVYPDKQYDQAVSALADYHNVKKENILIGSGCSELIYLAIRTLRPRKALIPMPTVKLYARACKNNGCEVVPFMLEKSDEFDIDSEKFISAVQSGIDMVILCNPNNPTSRIINKSKMKAILDFCQEKGIYVVVDEAFADFVSGDISVVRQIDLYANLIIIRTLSNYFALTGLRFAYLVSCESLTDFMRFNQIPKTVNYFSLVACEVLLKDFKYIRQTKSWLQTEPNRFFKILSTHGSIIAYKPYANYILIELEQMPSAVLCERLENKGVKVFNCTGFNRLEGQFIRIAIKDKKSNEKFLDIFTRCLL